MSRWLLMAILAAGIAAGGGYWFLQRELDQPLRVPADGLSLEVPVGMSLHALAGNLAAEGVIERPAVLTFGGRISGAASRIKAGEYLIEPGTTGRALLAQLVRGDVRIHVVTLIEGRTVAEALAVVQQHPAVRVTIPAVDPVQIGRLLGLGGQSAEGWLFPDTYQFERGTSDLDILRMAHELMQEKLAQAWRERSEGLPLRSEYDVLIMASIVEKETALDAERARIAGVFTRRLRIGMRLQTDPTIIYGLGKAFDGNLTRQDLQKDNPFNTYTRAGLPPTPIALPGERSLRAAVHPDDSGALFFVASASGDGSHVFSATLADHNAAVARLIRAP